MNEDEMNVPDIKCPGCDKIMKVVKQTHGDGPVKLLLRVSCDCGKGRGQIIMNEKGDAHIHIFDEDSKLKGYTLLKKEDL